MAKSKQRKPKELEKKAKKATQSKPKEPEKKATQSKPIAMEPEKKATQSKPIAKEPEKKAAQSKPIAKEPEKKATQSKPIAKEPEKKAISKEGQDLQVTSTNKQIEPTNNNCKYKGYVYVPVGEAVHTPEPLPKKRRRMARVSLDFDYM